MKPPTVHMKPSSERRKETLGRSGPARDRPFITKKPLEHLPATFGSGSPVRTAGVGGESGMGSTFGSATEDADLNKASGAA